MVYEIGCLDCQVASGTVISRIAVKDAKPDDVELFEEKVLLPKALDGGIIKEELLQRQFPLDNRCRDRFDMKMI